MIKVRDKNEIDDLKSWLYKLILQNDLQWVANSLGWNDRPSSFIRKYVPKVVSGDKKATLNP